MHAETPREETHAPSPGRALLCAALFAAAVGAASLAVRRVLAANPGARIEASVDLQQEKFDHWQRHHDEYDVVFVGSSRVYRELSPFVFDHVLATRGHPLVAFNFGLPGMWMPETLHVVDWLLSFESERLRYVVIELQELDAKWAEDNRFARRSLAWHEPELAWLASRTVLGSARPWPERLEETGAHALVALGNALNLGTGLPLASHLLGEDAPREPQARQGMPYNGWRPLEAEAEEQHGQRRQRLIERRAQLDADLAALAAAPRSAPTDALTREVLGALVQRVRAAGAEPIFLVPPPTHERHPSYYGALEEGVIPNLFAYNDPERYPELYDPERFFDLFHLQMRASVDFTDRFARDLADWLDARADG